MKLKTTLTLFAFTTAETAGLALFFQYGSGWVYDPTTIYAFMLMAVLLSVEHAIAFSMTRAFDGLALAQAIEISTFEAFVWVQWLVFAHGEVYWWSNLTVAFFVTVVLLTLQHSIELEMSHGTVSLGNLLRPDAVGVSLIEAMAASGWWVVATRSGDLWAAAAVLFAGLLVEHVVLTARASAVDARDQWDHLQPEGMSGTR